MANPVTINPTLTLAGQAAAFNASNDGLELKITHVSFGRAHYDPTGNEVALVDPVGDKVPVAGASRPTPYQIRMVSAWRQDVGQVGIGEIAFWAGDVMVFVWSKADGTVASYKTDGVTYVLFNDLAFAQVPPNSVSFVVDPDESVALAALAAHEGAYNAHPQYVLRAKFPDYQGHLWGEVAGTANAITLTLPAIVELTTYILGTRFSFKALYTNTGATTINIDGVGAVEVLKTGGLPLTAGSIIAGGVYDVYFDGTNFQLTAGAGFASAEATEEELLSNTENSESTSWVSVRRLLKALFKKAPKDSPTFTGDPKAPTPDVMDNDVSIATTAWGRLLLGRYGLGTVAYLFSGNIDQIKETGAYSTYASTTGTRPKHPTTGIEIVGGMVVHFERDGTGSAFQLWESVTTGIAAAGGGLMGISFRRSRLGSGQWTPWTVAWDSLNTPKQANFADATAGAMLTVGSFGWGGSAINFTGSIDTIVATGSYMISAGTTGTKPTSGGVTMTAGTILHLERGSSNMATQIWDSLIAGGDSLIFTRTRAASGWGSWQPFWHGGNTPTQARGDVSLKLATTEFVKEAGLVLPSSRIWIPLGSTLTQDHSGAHLAVGDSSSWTGTIYLPSTGIKVGSVFTIQISSGNGTLTLAVNNAPTGYISVGSSQLNDVTITSKDQPLVLACVANGIYQVISGPPDAIYRSVGPYRGKQVYKAAGVYQWTVPTNVYRVYVEVTGAGGSGGFGALDTGASGGGGGGFSERICVVNPGDVITVTVGAGGASVSTVGATGNAGGASSFGAFCSATGGGGGTIASGADGGVGVGGLINGSLGNGSPPVRNAGSTGALGGAGGGGESIVAANNYAALTQPGMGGGGRTSTRSQAGADGCVIITY